MDENNLKMEKMVCPSCKGTQFDPKLTDLFLNILKNDYDEIKNIQEKYRA